MAAQRAAAARSGEPTIVYVVLDGGFQRRFEGTQEAAEGFMGSYGDASWRIQARRV